MQDATGDRRYWPISTIRDRVDIEALRRDRDQILAEALQRLKSGEQHWPTPEEEERLIVPERQKYMPEAALEIARHPGAVHRRGAADDAAEPRGLRLEMAATATTSERALPRRLFRKCFGMYAAVKRQGLDRASKKDIAYCTTWLRENGWRRVQKRLPDGQRVRGLASSGIRR